MSKCSTVPSHTVLARMALIALLVFTAMATTTLRATPAAAAQASIAWSAPTDSTGVTGYKVHIGGTSGNYSQHVDVGSTTSYSASSLTDGSTYYFAVTAYNAAGSESAYSNEISRSFPALPTTYTITATAGAGGTITALNNTKVSTATSGSSTITSVTVTSGASQSFSIAPASGYKVAGVTVDGVSVGALTSYSFSNVTVNHTISATFAVNSYSITASAGTGGSITPSGTTAVAANGSQSYTITPATGYKIAGVTVDGTSVGAVGSYTFNLVSANHTIAASFALNSYTITATAGTGGTITPLGNATVASGGSQGYTVAATSGYKIADVKVDGVSKGAISSYTFSGVTANHTIAASFTVQSGITVFATNAGGAAFTGADGTAYKADSYYSGGTAKTITATIAGTTDDVLYQSYRYGSTTAGSVMSYNIPVANGNYSVVLKFADNVGTGQRVFDVKMEGTTVLSSFDIYAKAGNNTAYDVTIPVSVADGVLNIGFVTKISSPKINGIVVKTR
ncbi:malectin domain-containing carbohydrate-binding protein [Geomonas azotofigens]|uniref:malectin domain-containing carbohydrate-binding protein n=1 Tax=Geomonas azotofigens TaxID=2843196 RepID=UPI001C119270|nr:malectin domain-containing carbohydrate-binding protein [Geomonas azotofigens]MBU5614626.1 fibronectin type III domain-containing protein [Geomonas azotofigens]